LNPLEKGAALLAEFVSDRCALGSPGQGKTSVGRKPFREGWPPCRP
jgi:hypothetical protein